MGTLAVMDGTGDTKTVWDANSPDEVAAAKATFDSLKAKGYYAYSVEEGGGKGEIVHKFDPSAERLIMAPPIAGG